MSTRHTPQILANVGNTVQMIEIRERDEVYRTKNCIELPSLEMSTSACHSSDHLCLVNVRLLGGWFHSHRLKAIETKSQPTTFSLNNRKIFYTVLRYAGTHLSK